MRALLSLLVFCLALPAWAVTEPFSISSANLPPLPPSSQEPPSLDSRLQQEVVRRYLQRVLKDRFGRYEALITPKFAEDYIANYQITKQSADGTQMEIAGSLNTSGLDEWVRTNETKALGSSSLRPVFLFSSSIPAVQRQGAAGQAVYRAVQSAFQKFNAPVAALDGAPVANHTPTRDSEIRALRSFASGQGFNAAVWAQFSPCPRCGTRLELTLYNLTQNRLVQALRFDVPLSAAELGDGARFAKESQKFFQDFAASLEQAVSRGSLFANEFRITVEGVSDARIYKSIDSALGRMGWILSSSYERARSGTVTFKTLSTLDARDFAAKFQNNPFPQMTLRLTGYDSQGVTLRYLQ